MQYDEEKLIDFRQHLLSENGDFSVSFGDDYVAFHYGDGKQFAVNTPPGGAEATDRDKRLLAIMTLSQITGVMCSDSAMRSMGLQ